MAPRKKCKNTASQSKKTALTSGKLEDPSKALLNDSVNAVRRSTRQRLSEGTATFEERQQFVQMLELSQTEQKKEDQDSKCCRANAQKYLHSLATVIANHYNKVNDIRFCEVKDIELLRMIAVITNESTELIHDKICYYWSQKPSELKEKVKCFLKIKRTKQYEKLKTMAEDESQSDVTSTPFRETLSKDLLSFYPPNDDSTDEDEFWKPSRVTVSRKSRKLSSSTEDSDHDQQENRTEAERKETKNKATGNLELHAGQVAVDYSNEQSSQLESVLTQQQQQQQQQQKTTSLAVSFCSPERAKEPMYSGAVLTQPLPLQIQNQEDQVQAHDQTLHDFDNVPKSSSTNSSTNEVNSQKISSSSNNSTINNNFNINVSQADIDIASSMLLLPELQDRTALLQQLKELYYMSTEPRVQDQIVNIQAQLEAQHQYEKTVLQLRLEKLYCMPTSSGVKHAIADIKEKLKAPNLCPNNGQFNTGNHSALRVPVLPDDLASGTVFQIESGVVSVGLASEQRDHTSELTVEKGQLHVAYSKQDNQNSDNEDIQSPEVVDISNSDDECCVVFQSTRKNSSQTANGNSVQQRNSKLNDSNSSMSDLM